MEAFFQSEKAIVEIIIATLLAFLAAAVLEIVLQPLRKFLRRRGVISDLRKRSIPPPDDFAPLTITWKNADGEHTVSSLPEIRAAFESLLKSKDHIALMIGKFGMGKTFLSKYLSGLGRLEEGGNILPIYLDATRFGSGNIHTEIVSQLSQRLFDFGLPDLGKLCARSGTVFIVDGLDQMPTADKGGEILSGTIDFVKTNFEANVPGATVVLVIRSEFYETSTKLQELAEDDNLPLIIVEGFTEDWQREKFLLNADKEYGSMRLGKIRELTQSNDQLNELFERPLLLQRFTKISPEGFRSMAPSGVTLAKVYRMSFGELDAETREAGMRIATEFYRSATYAKGLHANLAGFPFLISDHALGHLQQSGILVSEAGSVHFSHATFRDYFAAEAILKAINENQGEEAMGGRIIHYLVSEFVAGLMNQHALNQLLNTIENSKDRTVRFNGMDILTEIVDDSMRNAVRKFLEKTVSNLNFASVRFDPEKLFLGSIAGIYGMKEPATYVLTQLNRLGADEFINKFFYTQEFFQYYGGSYDRCLAEWLDQLNTRKHGYFRAISCVLIAKMGFTRAIPVLTKVAGNPEEDEWIRESAAEALFVLRSTEAVENST